MFIEVYKDLYAGPFERVEPRDWFPDRSVELHQRLCLFPKAVVPTVPEKAEVISAEKWRELIQQTKESPVSSDLLIGSSGGWSDKQLEALLMLWSEKEFGRSQIPWHPTRKIPYTADTTPVHRDWGVVFGDSAFPQLHAAAIHCRALYACGYSKAIPLFRTLIRGFDQMAATAYSPEGFPLQVTVVHADFEYLSFTWSIWKLVQKETTLPPDKKVAVHTVMNAAGEVHDVEYYGPGLVGGYIYFGVGKGNSYTVQLDDSYQGWSRHS